MNKSRLPCISLSMSGAQPVRTCLMLLMLTWAALALSLLPSRANAGPPVQGMSVAGQSYMVLCYHSVPVTANGGSGANSTTNFAGQLAWLHANGYTAISMEQVMQAKAGKIRLPPKAFLLTVDDGYEDFYINVFPLLKIYRMPAVFALVGRWIEEGPDAELALTDPGYASQNFVTWAQVKEMSESGLVEMASHSYDLHHGIIANPQNNTEPAAVALQYSVEKQSYETVEQRRLRVREDLRKNSELIARYTGIRPRVMVWPYGAMDRIGAEEAAAAGMPINFTLADGLGSTTDTDMVPRILIGDEQPLSDFTYMVTHQSQPEFSEPVRAIRIDLDRIADSDPLKEEAKLSRLLEQTERLGVNTVLLQAFYTPPGSRYMSAGYFPNSVLPMRADLLNRVSWQLHNRLNMNVFMLINTSTIARTESGLLHPLDIHDPEDREYLLTLYSELSMAAPAQGLMFESALTDPAQLSFNKELLERSSFARPPMLFYAAADVTTAGNIIGMAAANALAGPYDKVALPLSMDLPPTRRPLLLKEFPERRFDLLTLPVKNASTRQLRQMAATMSVVQRNGMSDFMLDSDTFLDDPVKFDILRKAVSLKANPLLLPGQ